MAAVQNGLPPSFIRQIPVHCFAQARLEILHRPIAQFGHYLFRVDSVACIVAEPVFNIRNQGVGWCRIGAGRIWKTFSKFSVLGETLVQNPAQQIHNIDICPLIIPTDIVSLPVATILNDQFYAAGVIVDKQPVPNLLAVAINRQRPSLQDIQQAEWDELFWEMKGPVVV